MKPFSTARVLAAVGCLAACPTTRALAGMPAELTLDPPNMTGRALVWEPVFFVVRVRNVSGAPLGIVMGPQSHPRSHLEFQGPEGTWLECTTTNASGNLLVSQGDSVSLVVDLEECALDLFHRGLQESNALRLRYRAQMVSGVDVLSSEQLLVREAPRGLDAEALEYLRENKKSKKGINLNAFMARYGTSVYAARWILSEIVAMPNIAEQAKNRARRLTDDPGGLPSLREHESTLRAWLARNGVNSFVGERLQADLVATQAALGETDSSQQTARDLLSKSRDPELQRSISKFLTADGNPAR
jgi:hypothetical protein